MKVTFKEHDNSLLVIAPSSEPSSESPSAEPSSLSESEPDTVNLIRTLDAHMSGLKGSGYLKLLINHADSPIYSTNLYHLEMGSPKEIATDFDEIENGHYSLINPAGYYGCNPQIELPIEVADKTAIAQVAKHRQNLIEARVIAESENNLAAVEDIIDELEKVDDWICKAVNKFGRPRYFANKATKDYQNVDKALVKIVEKLREIDPALGQMCDNHLVRGTRPHWSSAPIRKRRK